MGGPALSAAGITPAGPPYLLDTHVWIWYVAGSGRLPGSLHTEIDAAIGRLWLPPISIWEVGMLHARRRIDLQGGPRPWLERALRVFPLEEAALTGEVALRSHGIDLGHRDPADHLLAATALVR